MNNKLKFLLMIVFVFINVIVYSLTKMNSDNIIKNTLKEDLSKLETHYNILNTAQKNIAYAIYKSVLRNTDVKSLLNTTLSEKEQSKNRIKLQKQLYEQYETAKKQGVLQLHFVDKNNICFLRMHKLNKFGDDLTSVRSDFNYTNKTKKNVRAFTQGRTAHGFRNIFPVYNVQNVHIGAMEVSFSSDRLEWYLNNVSNIHAHFLVNKKVFDSNTWKRDDLVLKYKVSNENPDYMLSYLHLPKNDCVGEDIFKSKKVLKEIESKMKLGKSFSSYAKDNGNVILFSYFPISNIENKNIAWISTYKKSLIIESALITNTTIRSITFILSIILIYFMLKQIISRQEIKKKKEEAEEKTKLIENKDKELQKQYDIFNGVLNATNNILFITDFKNIKFSNKKFKEIPKIEKRKKYLTNNGEYTMNCVFSEDCSNSLNCDKNFNILDMFVVSDGYLHKELLEKNESFVELVQRVEEKNRIVCIVDKNYEVKTFTINIIKLEYDENYLITLSDITKINEKIIQTEKKVYIDKLTGVFNRNKFDEIFEKEFKRAKRYNNSLSLAIVDIDKFKDFNDNYGHLVGDEVLTTMAQTLNNAIRETDTFARWGGEEFVILFIDTDINIAQEISNKLRIKISNNEHKIAGRINASFGVTQYKKGDTLQSIFKRCDDALYNAKENGRNRVEVL